MRRAFRQTARPNVREDTLIPLTEPGTLHGETACRGEAGVRDGVFEMHRYTSETDRTVGLSNRWACSLLFENRLGLWSEGTR